MDPQRFKAILITAALLGIGIGLMGFGWNMIRTDGLLDQKSAATEGRVIESSVYKGSRGGEWPSLVVEYSPTSHKPITRKFPVNRSTYQTALETRKVIVNYWPDDPQISRVDRFETLPYQLLIGLGGMILIAGLFCLMRYLKEPPKAGPHSRLGAEPG